MVKLANSAHIDTSIHTKYIMFGKSAVRLDIHFIHFINSIVKQKYT